MDTTNRRYRNFNKYVVSADGKVVSYFDSDATPESPALNQAIEGVLAASSRK